MKRFSYQGPFMMLRGKKVDDSHSDYVTRGRDVEKTSKSRDVIYERSLNQGRN